jgi:hypothetical protein
MNSARLPSAKRRMASESTTHASASKPYHLTLLDPATTTVVDVYKEWNEGLFGGVPLSQVDVNTQEWKKDPEMLLQYRIRRTIGKEIDARFVSEPRIMHPHSTEIAIFTGTQRFMDSHTPSTVYRLSEFLEFESHKRVYGGTFNWPGKESLPTTQAASTAARMPISRADPIPANAALARASQPRIESRENLNRKEDESAAQKITSTTDSKESST